MSEEEFVNSDYVKIGAITTLYFEHMGLLDDPDTEAFHNTFSDFLVFYLNKPEWVEKYQKNVAELYRQACEINKLTRVMKACGLTV